MNAKRPVKRFKRGSCVVSIFLNEVEREGYTIQIPKAVFQKRFRDKEGAWKTTSSLDTSDIPRAVLCLNAAFDYLTQSPDSVGQSD